MYGWRAKIGLITPIGENPEHAFHIYAPEGVSFTSAKITGLEETTGERLAAVEEQLVEAAGLYKNYDADLVFFGCILGSYMGGPNWDQTCAEKIERISGKPALSAGVAEIEALRALSCKKVAVLTPYEEALHGAERRFYEESGVEVSNITSMDVSYVLGKGRTLEVCDEYLLYRNALKMDLKGADVFLMSGLALCTMEIVDDLENALGIPVVTSQQAGLWSALRHCQVGAAVPQMGTLFRI